MPNGGTQMLVLLVLLVLLLVLVLLVLVLVLLVQAPTLRDVLHSLGLRGVSAHSHASPEYKSGLGA
jgi:hypothetical protein